MEAVAGKCLKACQIPKIHDGRYFALFFSYIYFSITTKRVSLILKS